LPFTTNAPKHYDKHQIIYFTHCEIDYYSYLFVKRPCKFTKKYS
jgi:hypothetical protein